MKRREFIRNISAGALSASVLGTLPITADDHVNVFDQYGGWTGKRFEPTGYFRIEKDDRWWFVTPEGNAFLSFGVNHFYVDFFNQEYGRTAWSKRLGVKEFHGPEFDRAIRKWFLDTCDRFGFNSVGVHNNLGILNNPSPAVPYMVPIHFVDLPHWRPEIPDENFVDVYAPEFARHCDNLAKERAYPVRNDPFVLGYAMTDCPLFTEEDIRERPDTVGGARRKSRIGWPRRLRNLHGKAPGKKAYVKTMKDIYRGKVADFNRTYGTHFKSFDALESAANWRTFSDLSNANETRDNTVFLQRTVGKYYETARNAIRRYDTNHLFFGDKLHANTDTLDTVLPVTSRYTDVIFYQMYARYEVQQPGLDRWSRITDKPFVNGDSSYTIVTDNMPRPYGPVADNIAQRAEWIGEFFRNAFARPNFIGWHYCGLVDATNMIARKQDRQHAGVFDPYGEPYPEVETEIRACSKDLYKIGTGA